MSSILVDLVANDMISGVIGRITGFASQAFSGLQGQLTEATKLQTTFIGNAGSLSAVSGMSFDDAKDFTKGLNIELSKVAAELPGVTADYVNFAQSIQGVIAKNYDLTDTLGVKTFRNDLVEISKRAVLLGQSTGTAAQDTAYYVKQFLSAGNTLASLNPLSFDDRNPSFILKVKERLDQIQKTTGDFKKMGSSQRQRILETVLKQLTPDQMIDEVKKTADSILASWKDSLVNQDIGIFGFLRQVQSRGDRSAMDAFTDLLSRIDSLGSTANRIMSSLGLTFDPMAVVISFFDTLGLWVTSFEAALEDFKGSSPSELVGHLVGGVGQWFSGITGTIRSIDPGKLANDIGSTVRTFFDSIDWHKLGSNFGNYAGTALTQAAIFVASLVLQPGMWISIIRAITDMALGFFTGLLGGIFGTLANDLNRGMKTSMGRLERATKNVFDWIADKWDAMKRGVEPVVSAAESFVKKVLSVFDWIQKLNPFSGKGISAPDAVKSLVPEPVKNAVGGAIDWVKGKLPGQPIEAKPSPVASPVAPMSSPVNVTIPMSPVTGTSPNEPMASPQASLALPSPVTNTNVATSQQLAFNPVINVSSMASDPNEVARVAVEAFRREYDRVKSQVLT